MAHMNQEKKAKLAPAIKAVLKKYKMKGSIGVNHYSTLVINISSGPLDIIGNYNKLSIERSRGQDRENYQATDYLDVNHFWIDENYTGKVKQFLNELKAAGMTGNHNNSDSMTDYFDVGWYLDINVGKWDKPYQLIK